MATLSAEIKSVAPEELEFEHRFFIKPKTTSAVWDYRGIDAFNKMNFLQNSGSSKNKKSKRKSWRKELSQRLNRNVSWNNGKESKLIVFWPFLINKILT